MKKNICLLLIAALMCSCAGQDNGKDDFITISIDPEDSQIVSIADFFEKIVIVPLETNDTILINAVYNIIPLNKRLYILDRRSSSVFIFSDCPAGCSPPGHDTAPPWPPPQCPED